MPFQKVNYESAGRIIRIYYSNDKSESKFVFVMPQNLYVPIFMRFGGVKNFHEIIQGEFFAEIMFY